MAGEAALGDFGRVLTAMVTPFTADGELDVPGTGRLAAHLADLGNDGLVVSGTTGESSTTSDAEKETVLRAVLEAVGDRVRVLAGVGTNDTRHTVELARQAEKAGAHGLLLVTPYYNRPSQEGLLAHFRTVADATDLPVMLYDIPARTGTAIATDTLLRLAEHPRIVADKDAKGDLAATQRLLAGCDLAVYSGDDAVNLPLLAVGALGVVSVTGHLVADRLAAMIAAVEDGDLPEARRINAGLVPVTDAVMGPMPGVMAVKAALRAQGLPAGPTRGPLVDADAQQTAQLLGALAAAGVDVGRDAGPPGTAE